MDVRDKINNNTTVDSFSETGNREVPSSDIL